MRRAGLLAALLCALAGTAHATRYCDSQSQFSAEQKDKIFRFGAVIKAELERSGAGQALIARSGLDLSRFNIRYSHAGVSLRASPDTPWAVRQLYFACDEGKPLVFDQGLAAFLMGTSEPSLGYVSVLLLPQAEGAQLQRAALDKQQALALLGGEYSANAYPFSLEFQNCNQWVMELLAAAWGKAERIAKASSPSDVRIPTTRAQAQNWLREAGYEPTVVEAGWMAGLTPLVPWLQRSDHPREDLEARRFRTSMPASIEDFVHRRLPAAQRLEFCHNSRHVVVRRGWQPIAEGCLPGADDQVVKLD
ncbi:MAG TPA: DUF2145 domain-containing protein [Rubrivivax sp.]|nr:DUF2145 domain-containing protein [Rubrivivax sp.]